MLDNKDADLNMMQRLFPSSLDGNLCHVLDKSPQRGAIDGYKNIHQMFKFPINLFDKSNHACNMFVSYNV